MGWWIAPIPVKSLAWLSSAGGSSCLHADASRQTSATATIACGAGELAKLPETACSRARLRKRVLNGTRIQSRDCEGASRIANSTSSCLGQAKACPTLDFATFDDRQQFPLAG